MRFSMRHSLDDSRHAMGHHKKEVVEKVEEEENVRMEDEREQDEEEQLEEEVEKEELGKGCCYKSIQIRAGKNLRFFKKFLGF